MRLTDLDPRWLHVGGTRLGFAFRSPTNPKYWQTCWPTPISSDSQQTIHDDILGEDEIVQGCNGSHRWQIAGGIENADFETMTVTPSLDGSAGGLWHGYITNGEIVGGLNESQTAQAPKQDRSS